MYDKTSHITKLQFSLREPIPEEQGGRQLKKISQSTPGLWMCTFAWACICLCEHTYTYMHLRRQCIYTMPAYTANKDHRKQTAGERCSCLVSYKSLPWWREGENEEVQHFNLKRRGSPVWGTGIWLKKHFHFHAFAYQSPVDCLATDLCHR